MRKILSLLLLLLVAQPTMLKAEEFDDGIDKKVEFRVEAGGSYGTFKDKSLLGEIGLGYNIDSHWYLGAVTGLFYNYGYCLGGNPGSYVPTMVDLSYRINDTNNDEMSGFLSVRAGMLWHMKSPDSIFTYMDEVPKVKYIYQDYFALEIMPGFIWRPKRNLDLRLSAGYCLAVPGDDGLSPHATKTQHSFEARVGMAFRGKPTSASRREVRIHNLEETYKRQRAADAKRKREAERKLREGEQRAAEDREARRREREDASRRRAAESGAIR